MRIIALFACFAGLYSCSEDIIDAMNKRINYLGQYEHIFIDGYQISSIRDEANPSYMVNRFGKPDEYAVIRTKPKSVIEKNFISEDSLIIDFVDAFAKLDCRYLYYGQSFKRIDLLRCHGFFKRKQKIILFKGDIPSSQNFVLPNSIIKELSEGWKYLIVAEE
jgi:hypothetical protein